MNTETTLISAIILAIIIVSVVFAAVSGTIGKGSKGVDNLTGRTDKGSDNEYDFTSNQIKPPRKISEIRRKEPLI